MRPRALLNVTAICLLLAAATVWALPPPPEPPAAAAARKTSALGKTSLGNQLGKPAAEQKPAVAEKASAAQKPGSAAQKESTLKTLDQTAALKQRAGLEQLLKQVPAPQLELLQKIGSGLPPVSIVDGTVKRFSQDFEAGARNPERFLSDVRLTQPALLSEWQNTPREKRIFVIGSGKDSAKVSELAESLKSDGYAVFFYKFCGQSRGALCSSKAVGAMFGMSGNTMIYQTPSAELSKYVDVEVATARFIEGLDKQVVLISTTDLLAGKFAMYVANMPTPTPSAVK